MVKNHHQAALSFCVSCSTFSNKSIQKLKCPLFHYHSLYTHCKHGAEVAEISEKLIHRGLLGVDSIVLQHVLVQHLHVAVHGHQLAMLLPCTLAEAVRAVVKVNKSSLKQVYSDTS